MPVAIGLGDKSRTQANLHIVLPSHPVTIPVGIHSQAAMLKYVSSTTATAAAAAAASATANTGNSGRNSCASSVYLKSPPLFLNTHHHHHHHNHHRKMDSISLNSSTSSNESLITDSSSSFDHQDHDRTCSSRCSSLSSIHTSYHDHSPPLSTTSSSSSSSSSTSPGTGKGNTSPVLAKSIISSPKVVMKIYTNVLCTDVEYKTLSVGADTTSGQIVRTILAKFRLKHRDPNLFYLTLEAWIKQSGTLCAFVTVLVGE